MKRSISKKANKKKRVYLDYAAGAPIRREVLNEMMPFLKDAYGNPSSIYSSGRVARKAVSDARNGVAKIFGCSNEEIIFTGSGTESAAMAIIGILNYFNAGNNKPGIVVGSTEHNAVLKNAEYMEKRGFNLTQIPVDSEGFVRINDLRESINDNTCLVSVMYANNEIGTINPLKKISRIVKLINIDRKKRNISLPLYFHSDACQAGCYLDLNVSKLGVDLMTINGSKIYGPKGVGVLYKKKNIKIQPFWKGGGQEQNLRSGTENMAGIVGIAKALECTQKDRIKNSKKVNNLQKYFVSRILAEIPKTVLNGPKIEKFTTGENAVRLPNNINVSFLDIEGEAILLYLDNYGIEASTGSACDSDTLDPSHVITALGKPYEFAHASIRFSLGENTTKSDIDYVMLVLPNIISILRDISPIDINLDAKEMSSSSAFSRYGMPHWEVKKKAKKNKIIV